MDEELLDDVNADLLLAELGRALASEITDERFAAAIDTFWVARTDALIAEIEEHLDVDRRAGIRGVTKERQHSYRLDDLSVFLTLDSVDRRVDGRIDGVVHSARWLHATGASEALDLDERGGFNVRLSGGPVAVEVLLTDGRRVRTSWTLL